MSGPMAATNVRLGVLASGRGSNLQAIIDAVEAGALDARIAVVVSNKKDAQALERARKHHIAELFLDPKPFASRDDKREAYDRAILEILKKHNVDLVLLAGYMKIVTPLLDRCLLQSHHEHSSIALAVLPRTRRAEASLGVGRENGRVHRALCDRRRGCRTDHSSSGRADSRTGFAGHISRANSR